MSTFINKSMLILTLISSTNKTQTQSATTINPFTNVKSCKTKFCTWNHLKLSWLHDMVLIKKIFVSNKIINDKNQINWLMHK